MIMGGRLDGMSWMKCVMLLGSMSAQERSSSSDGFGTAIGGISEGPLEKLFVLQKEKPGHLA